MKARKGSGMRLSAVALLAALTAATAGAQQEILTNEKMIRMIKAGITEDIVMMKLATEICDFRTDSDSLVALVEAGVPTGIIRAMMERMRKQEDELGVRVQMLVQTLRASKVDEYRRAVRELVRIGSRAVPRLLEYLAAPDEVIRGGVTEVLGQIGDVSARGRLLLLFEDDHPGVRAKAARAVAYMCDEATLKRLLAMLDKPSLYRDAPAQCLGHLKEKSAVKPLMKLMQDALAREDDRASAAFALGLIGDAAALDALVSELLETRAARVRETAATAISRIGPFYGPEEKEKSARALLEAYGRYPHNRALIAQALGEFTLAPVIDALIESLNDENPEAQDACYKSLKHITGEVMDRDYEQWNSWWQLARARYEK